MVAMNHAVRRSFFGVGWVMPKVLIKALDRKRSGRMVVWMITDSRRAALFPGFMHPAPWLRILSEESAAMVADSSVE